MNQQDDAGRLANLLKDQRAAVLAMAGSRDPKQREHLKQQIEHKRAQCLELVERYFRVTLRPVLAKRFPAKGIQSAPAEEAVHSNDTIFRYTELVNDFFVQVLSQFDDPFWKKDSAIELRNYASIVISNRGVRDALRRRRKRAELGDEQVRLSFEDLLAAEVEQRFLVDGVELDPADVLEVLEQWRNSQDQRRQKMAVLLRHKYVSGMDMQQIASDLKVSLAAAYRLHAEALNSLRQFFSPCQT